MHKLFKQFSTIIPGIRVSILRLSENRHEINRSIIPNLQIEAIKKNNCLHEVEKRLLARSFLYKSLLEDYGINSFDLKYNRFMKPSLACGTKINFSLSYSNDYVVVCTSDQNEVGIDIEYVNSDIKVSEIAPQVLCSTELLKFNSTSDNWKRSNYFFKVFTKKESLVKALGEGLYYDVQRINTENNMIELRNGQFKLQQVELNREYPIFLAYRL